MQKFPTRWPTAKCRNWLVTCTWFLQTDSQLMKFTKQEGKSSLTINTKWYSHVMSTFGINRMTLNFIKHTLLEQPFIQIDKRDYMENKLLSGMNETRRMTVVSVFGGVLPLVFVNEKESLLNLNSPFTKMMHWTNKIHFVFEVVWHCSQFLWAEKNMFQE